MFSLRQNDGPQVIKLDASSRQGRELLNAIHKRVHGKFTGIPPPEKGTNPNSVLQALLNQMMQAGGTQPPETTPSELTVDPTKVTPGQAALALSLAKEALDAMGDAEISITVSAKVLLAMVEGISLPASEAPC